MTPDPNHVLQKPVPNPRQIGKEFVCALLEVIPKLLNVRVPLVQPFMCAAINSSYLINCKVRCGIYYKVMLDTYRIA